MTTRKVKRKFESIELGQRPTNPHEAINFARRAYDEGYRVGKDARLEQEQCEAMGREAWRQCLPLLCERTNVTAFVACVAHGLQLQILTAEEARVLMYAAQMALASFRQEARR